MMLDNANNIKVRKVSLLDPISIVKTDSATIETAPATNDPRPPENQTAAICILNAKAMNRKDGHQME